MSTAVLTGSFTLAGAVLGAAVLFAIERLRRRTATQHWLLDRRHAEYAEFCHRAYDFVAAAAACMRPKGSYGDGELEEYEVAAQRRDELRRAGYRLHLITTHEMANRAYGVVAKADEVPLAVMASERPEVEKLISGLEASLARFVLFARWDLHGDEGQPRRFEGLRRWLTGLVGRRSSNSSV